MMSMCAPPRIFRQKWVYLRSQSSNTDDGSQLPKISAWYTLLLRLLDLSPLRTIFTCSLASLSQNSHFLLLHPKQPEQPRPPCRPPLSNVPLLSTPKFRTRD